MHGPSQRTRHTRSAETLVTVMANLRLNGASERTTCSSAAHQRGQHAVPFPVDVTHMYGGSMILPHRCVLHRLGRTTMPRQGSRDQCRDLKVNRTHGIGRTLVTVMANWRLNGASERTRVECSRMYVDVCKPPSNWQSSRWCPCRANELARTWCEVIHGLDEYVATLLGAHFVRLYLLH